MFSSTSFAGQGSDPGFDAAYIVSTLHQRFTCVRLLDSHLMEYFPPFVAALTTKTLDQRRLPRFEICACTPISRDLTSSWLKHRHHRCYDSYVRSTQTPDPPFYAGGTRQAAGDVGADFLEVGHWFLMSGE